MKKIRKLAATAIAAAMVLAMSLPAFAADATSKTAQNTALRNAKLTAKQVEKLRTKYEIEIQAPTGKTVEYGWEYKGR